jgi:hypothetical protein
MSKMAKTKFTLMGKPSKVIPVKLPLPNLSFLGLLIVLSGEAFVESIDSFENRKGTFHSAQQDESKDKLLKTFTLPKFSQWYIKPGQWLSFENKSDTEPLIVFIASPLD